MGSDTEVRMKRSFRNQFIVFSGCFVPFITLFSPNWLAISGVPPCWAVLWLLPLALVEGPKIGILAGFSLGLALDAIFLNGVTQVPGLIALGFLSGRIGKQGIPIDSSLNLGLLAWLGTIIFGLSIWIQQYIRYMSEQENWFNLWAFHTLLAQAILTGLLAPLICSWLLIRMSSR